MPSAEPERCGRSRLKYPSEESFYGQAKKWQKSPTKKTRLLFRRYPHRGPQGNASVTRGQRCKFGRNDEHWSSGTARFYDHDRNLCRLQQCGSEIPHRNARRSQKERRNARKGNRQAFWLRQQSASRFRPFRSRGEHAGDDGHRTQPGSERQSVRWIGGLVR